MEATDEALLYLSALTMGEIRKGLAGLSQGKRRTRLEGWFAGRIVPIDAAIADRWSLLGDSGEAER
jgi:predicted nucleic acid-binding protein